jgi:signal transduction histidine kinase
MSDQARALSSERAIYRDYEHKRRLRLVSTLLPIFAIIQFGVFLASAAAAVSVHYPAPYGLVFLINTGLVGIDAGIHTLGIRYAREERVRLATLCLVVPTGISVIEPALSYGIVLPHAPLANSPLIPISLSVVTALSILIVQAGLLSTTRAALFGTTLLMNGFSIYIMSNVLHAPGISISMTNGALLLVVLPIFVQWAVAGILYATSATYVQTLRELGDVRIAYQRAQQLDQLKDQFISHVNHELRSPVMALQGHVELLLLTDETLTRNERHTYLERAKHAGDQLVALVTSILAARRLEQEVDRFTPEAVPLREALESAIQMIDPREGQHVERALQVDISSGMVVWGEPVRIRQIFTNLLSNAIKYSPPGTPIEVEARVVSEAVAASGGRARRRLPRRQQVEITVRDHGLGIPADQLPLLFNRFVRLERDLMSNVPGNGLGLYLCQEYARAMGGTIWVESTGIEFDGSTFHLRLPLPPIPEIPTSPQPAPVAATRRESPAT